MPENKVKGDIFLKVLDQVVKKWGEPGLKKIGADPSQYEMEQWYPFSELCALLRIIKETLGKNNPLAVYQLGFRIMKDDPQWQGFFDDKDPAEIFLSTKRQDTQYKAGIQTLERINDKHTRVNIINWECDDIWYEFFRGHLQGVLELTGRAGVVHLIPGCSKEGVRILDIKWG